MTTSRLIAIAGGSGSGKSHLVDRLCKALAPRAAVLQLDHFYRDLSHLPAAERAETNFDHPGAIDWPEAEAALACLTAARPANIPQYDFASHTRDRGTRHIEPRPFILLDGLWPLTRPAIRALSTLSIFVECPADLRLSRRIARDTRERGRSEQSVRLQFEQHVRPMHDRHVQGQAALADMVVVSPVRDDAFAALLRHPALNAA